MSAGPDRWIRWTTTGCVALLALIAGTVSYLHMHLLVEVHGQPGWVAALTPLWVDGMIVAASTTLLAHSRCGGRGGVLPWALLVAGSVASLAANVAVAEPTATGRVIAAWPSFALIAANELLMRQVRRSAAARGKAQPRQSARQLSCRQALERDVQCPRKPSSRPSSQGDGLGQGGASRDLQRRAWQWAVAIPASHQRKRPECSIHFAEITSASPESLRRVGPGEWPRVLAPVLDPGAGASVVSRCQCLQVRACLPSSG
jgi:hypothetical protein